MSRLRALCEVAGITVDDEEAGLLLALLESQMKAAEALLAVEADDLEPITVFDPTWR
ncbi:MAG TPA: hypothetical protein VM848_08420 [Acidimicrobiia bacterium]|nr:hypothetical protein [Acidimicrobiia bacterium]